MPKGKHKGKQRVFTNPEELEAQRLREERERDWRKKRGDVSSDEDDTDASGSGSSSSSGDEQEAKPVKPKGPSVLMEDVHNPNRQQVKTKKMSQLSLDDKAPLSRREREAVEQERARRAYQKLHAEGKTDEARADLARLAVIRKQREAAAKRREEERQAKEPVKTADKTKR